jgi:hypothetical protein
MSWLPLIDQIGLFGLVEIDSYTAGGVDSNEDEKKEEEEKPFFLTEKQLIVHTMHRHALSHVKKKNPLIHTAHALIVVFFTFSS